MKGRIQDAGIALSTKSYIGQTTSQASSGDVFESIKDNYFMNPKNDLPHLLKKSEYLQQYPSWLGFVGTENKKQFAPTFLARNDTIWELIFSERGYMDMLLMVRDVYMLPFPEFEPIQYDAASEGMTSAKLREALFPGLNKLIKAHERILRPLLALHDQAEDKVIKHLGACLAQLFDKTTQDSLARLYGGFMFAQRRIREQLVVCNRWPPVAAFFEKCKQDARSGRRSLGDCHTLIVQRWTKFEPLIDAIIRNTLNNPTEVEHLESVRKAVRCILKGAESVMTAREHVEKLHEFANGLLVPGGEDTEEHKLRAVMRSSSTTLINYGPLRIVLNPVGAQLSSPAVDVIGLGLNSCFCVLQKMPESGRYQLFRGTKMPPILWWGQVYGYFRRSVEKGSFGFFILLQSEAVLTLYRCSTVDDLVRWEKVINDGFSQWQTLQTLDHDLAETKSMIEARWQRTEAILQLLNELDENVLRVWSARNCVCLALIEEQLKILMSKNEADDGGNDSDSRLTSSPSDSQKPPKAPGRSGRHTKAASPPTVSEVLEKNTFLKSLDNNSDLDQLFAMFQDTLARLHFSLVGRSTSSLSRSASDVEERKHTFPKPVRKNETFSARDNVNHPGDSKDLARKSSSKKEEQLRWFENNPVSSLLAKEFSIVYCAKVIECSTDHSGNFYVMQRMKTHSGWKLQDHQIVTNFYDALRQMHVDTQVLSTSEASGSECEYISKQLWWLPLDKSKNTDGSLKREANRLSSTMVSLFRTGSRDKPSADFFVSPSGQPPKGPSNQRVPSIGGSDTSHTSSSTPLPPNILPRPSFSFLSGAVGEALQLSVDGSGSSNSLSSQHSIEAWTLLRNLDQLSEEFFPSVFRLRTKNDELDARVRCLETEKDKLETLYKRAKQHGLIKSTCPSCGGSEGLDSSGADVSSALTVKQGTEKLRQDVENFRIKSEEWEKEYSRQRDALEREHTKLAEQWKRYEKAREELEHKQRQYEENCKTLQQQVDLHASRGVKFSGITMPEIRLPDVTTSTTSSRGSSPSLRELSVPDFHSNPRPSLNPIHFHSASDDLASRRSPRGSQEFYPPCGDATPRPSLGLSSSVRSEELPIHLRGSLLNQAKNQVIFYGILFATLTRLTSITTVAGSSPLLAFIGRCVNPLFVILVCATGVPTANLPASSMHGRL
ncbi:Rho guanine nucleotide exchange factor 1 [Clonorchis sinensis]|uniref:Rho guanine nucleotide exchange factor 1 n=1 Tax=Clonorchis sinensis TaxID=79923 RepID=G7YI33_CLOSI|nr:Rho guanine nucleotide exchange factor 1 [Clonorchis sinensis]